MGSLGDGLDPERPVWDQALTRVDAGIATQYAKRLPLVHHAEAITNAENRSCRMTAMGQIQPSSTGRTLDRLQAQSGRSIGGRGKLAEVGSAFLLRNGAELFR